jgi:hypothetical protein
MTEKERFELKVLSQKLFGNDKFKVFSDEEKATEEYKRYDFLVKKKLEILQAERN